MRQRRLAGWGLVAPAALWTLAFFVLPLGLMALLSLRVKQGTETLPGLSLANYARFLDKGFFGQALLNSLEVTALVCVVSLLLAYPLAWILAYRVPRHWQRLALLLALLPFWTSYIVRSYAWLLVLGDNGVVLGTLRGLGLPVDGVSLVHNRTGTVIGFVHFFVMLLTLTIWASLVQIPVSYLRAAADLGASAWSAFWRITLPLSLPGVVVGVFLTFVLAIGDYITPQILGGNREQLLPQSIMLQIGRSGDFPMASALALVLMLVVTLAYLACARWLKLDRV